MARGLLASMLMAKLGLQLVDQWLWLSALAVLSVIAATILGYLLHVLVEMPGINAGARVRAILGHKIRPVENRVETLEENWHPGAASP